MILTPCRDAVAEEMPTGAARLAKVADESGWTVRSTFASTKVTDDKVIDSVVVRVRRGPLAAVGAWHNRKFELAYVWSAFSPPRRVGARDLSRFVKGGES